MRLSRVLVPALVLPLALGCTGGDDPSGDPDPTDGPTPTGSGATAGPVAGSGAGLSPDDPAAWCGAVTAAQLTALTGFEVSAVDSRGTGVATCEAELPGVDLRLEWGSEATRQTPERYAAGWSRPAGVFTVTPVSLPGRASGVRATTPSPRRATAGAVVDGRLVEVTVVAVAADDTVTAEDLGAMAEQVLAVYVG